MDLYFSCSLTGGRNDPPAYAAMVAYLRPSHGVGFDFRAYRTQDEAHAHLAAFLARY